MDKAREHELFRELKAARLDRDEAIEAEEEVKCELASKKTIRRKVELLIEEILDEITTGKRRDPLIELCEAVGRAAAAEEIKVPSEYGRCPNCGHVDHDDCFDIAGADDGKVFCPNCEAEVEVGEPTEDEIAGAQAIAKILDPEPETADERQRGPTGAAPAGKFVATLQDAVRTAFAGLVAPVKEKLMTGATDEEIAHALPSLMSFRFTPGTDGGTAWAVSGGSQPAIWWDGAAKSYPSRKHATLDGDKLIRAVRLACKIPHPARAPEPDPGDYLDDALSSACWPDGLEPEWNEFRKSGSISDREIADELKSIWPAHHVHQAEDDPGRGPGWTTFGGGAPTFWLGDKTHAGPRPLGLHGSALADAVRRVLRIPGPSGAPKLPGGPDEYPTPPETAAAPRRTRKSKPAAVAAE